MRGFECSVTQTLLTSEVRGSSTSRAVGANLLVSRSENTRLVILHEQQSPAFQGVICPWASGAYRLEAVVFYGSLKHSHLNLRPNFSCHTELTSPCCSVSIVLTEPSRPLKKTIWSWKSNIMKKTELEVERYKLWPYLLKESQYPIDRTL